MQLRVSLRPIVMKSPTDFPHQAPVRMRAPPDTKHQRPGTHKGTKNQNENSNSTNTIWICVLGTSRHQTLGNFGQYLYFTENFIHKSSILLKYLDISNILLKTIFLFEISNIYSITTHSSNISSMYASNLKFIVELKNRINVNDVTTTFMI